MFEGLLLPWQQIYHIAFNSIFRATPEVSTKLYNVGITQVSEKLRLFNHQRADFLASKFFRFSASLKENFSIQIVHFWHPNLFVSFLFNLL